MTFTPSSATWPVQGRATNDPILAEGAANLYKRYRVLHASGFVPSGGSAAFADPGFPLDAEGSESPDLVAIANWVWGEIVNEEHSIANPYTEPTNSTDAKLKLGITSIDAAEYLLWLATAY